MAQSHNSLSNDCQNPVAELSSLERAAFVAQANGRMNDSLMFLSNASREPGSLNSPLAQARIESEIGDIFLSKGEWEQAYQHKKRAFDAFQAGGIFIEVRRTALSLTTILLERKQFNDASRYLDIARYAPVASKCLDDDDRATLSSLSSSEDQLAGALNAAVTDSRNALEYWSLAHGANHPFTGWGHLLLADAYANAGRSKEALSEFRLAVAILGGSLPKSDKHYLTAVREYGRELQKSGDELKTKNAWDDTSLRP
jgi:tetratricopeptide (TPR) repeat protein